MAISELQNFYKETIAVACTTGATNIYVSTKPTPTNGFLVISPGTESLREIIKYTGTGTDGTGDYVTVLASGDRGLGGTTDQAHAVGESVRMNYTAQHQTEIDDTITAIVAAGAPDASTTVKGISKLSTAPASPTAPIAVGDNDPRLNATTGLTADQEGAVAGASASPTASNAFVTEDDLADPTFKPPQVVPFTASGTWTKDAGLKYIIVEAVGGGGGGDSIEAASANRLGSQGGGGGGGYSRKMILASALGATETVTVGAGGVGAPTSTYIATAGGNTTFGAHVTCNGGAEGADDLGGLGGVATGGDVNIAGANGGNAVSIASTLNEFKRGYGYGGDSMMGRGGRSPASFGAGASGVGYGAGGSGAELSPSANYAGGAGAVGVVIVTEYYV